MGWKQMQREMDSEEITYQMALDLVEADELKARRAGVPTASDLHASPPGRRLSAKDPDWFKKLERWTG